MANFPFTAWSPHAVLFFFIIFALANEVENEDY